MRTRLKTVTKIRDFTIDADQQTATITYAKDLDLESTLNDLAKVNNKLADWSFQNKE